MFAAQVQMASTTGHYVLTTKSVHTFTPLPKPVLFSLWYRSFCDYPEGRLWLNQNSDMLTKSSATEQSVHFMTIHFGIHPRHSSVVPCETCMGSRSERLTGSRRSAKCPARPSCGTARGLLFHSPHSNTLLYLQQIKQQCCDSTLESIKLNNPESKHYSSVLK